MTESELAELVRFAVHEARGPLSGVLLNAEACAEEPGLSDDGRSAFGDLRTAAESLQRLVDNLDAIARWDQGEVAGPARAFDLTGVVRSAAGAMASRVLQREQTLAVEGEPHTANGVEDIVRRAVQNMLEHALRRTPSRGAVVVRVVGGPARAAVVVTSGAPAGTPRAATPLDRFGPALSIAFAERAALVLGGSLVVAPQTTTFELPAG